MAALGRLDYRRLVAVIENQQMSSAGVPGLLRRHPRLPSVGQLIGRRWSIAPAEEVNLSGNPWSDRWQDVQYRAAQEKCDALAGSAKDSWVVAAKVQYGRP